nr:PREDICTED: scaffold attachment factor B2-like [Equus przewalskii]
MIPGWGRARASTPFLCSLGFFHKWNLRPFCDKTRREDPYWPEGKRLAVEDRYRPDLPRPDHRFHDCDHRDRGQYQDHVADRREGPRAVMGERDGQHYDDRHSHGGPPERHSRDSRDGWGGYGSDKRMSEARGLPPPPRGGRDWTEHCQRLDEHPERTWPGTVDAGTAGARAVARWRAGPVGALGAGAHGQPGRDVWARRLCTGRALAGSRAARGRPGRRRTGRPGPRQPRPPPTPPPSVP